MIELAGLGISPVELIDQYGVDREVVRACCTEVGIDLASIENGMGENRKKEVLNLIVKAGNKKEGHVQNNQVEVVVAIQGTNKEKEVLVVNGKESESGKEKEKGKGKEKEVKEQGEILEEGKMKSSQKRKIGEIESEEEEGVYKDDKGIGGSTSNLNSDVSGSRKGKERERDRTKKEVRDRDGKGKEKGGRERDRKDRSKDRSRSRSRERERDRDRAERRKDKEGEKSKKQIKKEKRREEEKKRRERREEEERIAYAAAAPSSGDSFTSFFNPAFGIPRLFPDSQPSSPLSQAPDNMVPQANLNDANSSSSSLQIQVPVVSFSQNGLETTETSSNPSSAIDSSARVDLEKKMREAALASIRGKKRKLATQPPQPSEAPPPLPPVPTGPSLLRQSGGPALPEEPLQDEGSDMDMEDDQEEPVAMESQNDPALQEFLNSLQAGIQPQEDRPVLDVQPQEERPMFSITSRSHPSLPPRPGQAPEGTTSFDSTPGLPQLRIGFPLPPPPPPSAGAGLRTDSPFGQIDPRARLRNLTYADDDDLTDIPTGDVDFNAPLPSLAPSSSFSSSTPLSSTLPSRPVNNSRRRPVASDFDSPQEFSPYSNPAFSSTGRFPQPVERPFISAKYTSIVIRLDDDNDEAEDSGIPDDEGSEDKENSNARRQEYTRKMYAMYKEKMGIEDPPPPSNHRQAQAQASRADTPSESLLSQKELEIKAAREKLAAMERRRKALNASNNVNGGNASSETPVHLLIEDAIRTAHDRSPLPSPSLSPTNRILTLPDLSTGTSTRASPAPFSPSLESTTNISKLEAALQSEKALLKAAIEAQEKKSKANGKKRQIGEPFMEDDKRKDKAENCVDENEDQVIHSISTIPATSTDSASASATITIPSVSSSVQLDQDLQEKRATLLAMMKRKQLKKTESTSEESECSTFITFPRLISSV